MEEVNEKEKEISLKEFGSDSDGISSRDNSDSISSKNTDEGEVSIADEFEILEIVGEGGMGSVYKVRDKNLDKVFAVKVLKKDIAQDQSAYKRFEQEAEATSKLSHQNVISTYKYGRTESGQPYLVMDYLEGKSLAEYIEEKSLNTDQIIDIFIQICQGLEHAHENKIIHRDIKPTNIILNPNSSGSFDVKILDFGIAKVVDGSVRETHNLTQTGEVYGSPQYMSPEQCLGFMLEEQSDIYSLGCTLYETITGKPPFAGANPIQLVVKHINEDVEEFKARHRSNKKQKQLEKITFKCLEKEQADRIQSASTLKRDLESIKNGKAIPNYILKPKEKSERRHHYNAIIGAITGASVWKLLYSNVALVQDYFWVGLVLAVACLYCLCVFSSTAITAFKTLIKGKENIKKWWIACMSSSAALIGFGAFFQLAIKLSYPEPIDQWAPFQILQFNSMALLLIFVATILLIASSIGYIVFNKVKKSNFIVTILAHLALLASTIAIPSLAIPNIIANVTGGLAEKTSETLPAVSEFFLEQSCSLDSYRRRENYMLLAQAQFDSGNKEKAIKTIDHAIEETSKNEFHYDRQYLNFHLAEFYDLKASLLNKSGKYHQAVESTRKAIKLDEGYIYYEEERGQLATSRKKPRDRTLSLSHYLINAGHPEEALKILDSKKTSSRDEKYYFYQALALAALDKDNEAIDILSQSANKCKMCHVLKALIYEKLGDKKIAYEEYKCAKVFSMNPLIPNHEPTTVRDSRGFLAYIDMKLADSKSADKLLSNTRITREYVLSYLSERGFDKIGVPIKWESIKFE